MPRRPPPERRAKVKSLNDFSSAEMFAFGAGWNPGDGHWMTWREFLSDWKSIRDRVEYGADGRATNAFLGERDACFAEWMLTHHGIKGPSPKAMTEVRYSPYATVAKAPRYLVDYWVATGGLIEVEVEGAVNPRRRYYVDRTTEYALSVTGDHELEDGRVVRLKESEESR